MMHLTTKELWKILNAAWDKRDDRLDWVRWYGYEKAANARMRRRYRDVSKIIKEAEKAKEEKDG